MTKKVEYEFKIGDKVEFTISYLCPADFNQIQNVITEKVKGKIIGIDPKGYGHKRKNYKIGTKYGTHFLGKSRLKNLEQ